ncbi:MAG: hypothetical protein F6K62_11690 [Sphaerospermopsis sp. SIO1G2]|nr:hypothetical protein [Sphaerospermopsis sp. SIO1G2]
MPRRENNLESSDIAAIATFPATKAEYSSIMIQYKDYRTEQVYGAKVIAAIDKLADVENDGANRVISEELEGQVREDLVALYAAVDATGVTYSSARDAELEKEQRNYDSISLRALKVDDIPDVSETTSDMVTIYHGIGKDADLDAIRATGLKSRKKLAEEGVMQLPSDGSYFTNQPQYIYFQDMTDDKLARQNRGFASVSVDPDTTYVFNREFRVPHGQESNSKMLDSYARSGITLRQHLANQEAAKQMKEDLPPGQMVIHDPYSGSPIAVSADDERVSNSRYMYLSDILVEAAVIPKEKLTFHEPQRDQSEEKNSAVERLDAKRVNGGGEVFRGGERTEPKPKNGGWADNV